MAHHPQTKLRRKPKSSKGSRALSAILSRETSDIVIAGLVEAFASATLPKGTEIGLARLKYLKDYVWSKYADPLPGESYSDATVRKTAAIAKWQQAEYRNASTNCRLTSGEHVTFSTKRIRGARQCTFTSGDVINNARGIVKSVLGLHPPRLDDVQGVFTNGASTRVKRTPTAVAEKFEGRPHATAQVTSFWPVLAFANPGWGHLNPEGFNVEVTEGSVLFTVPKNSRIDRVACKEPEVNSYLQRAYGIFIRTRLKKYGIDLQDQSRNQYLSRVAIDRGLATVDLSSASDTISRELVRALLPVEWYDLLDSLRSHSVEVPSSGFRHQLEMFSSMGNGFTFELESLIFWALTRTLARFLRVKGTISVYGDDIICPIPVAKLLVRVFAYFGFSVNRSKSCISGGYRESCGAHWYYGHDVKPFFVRERPKSISDLIQIANQLMAWMSREENPDDIPTQLLYAWGLLATRIPQFLYGGQSFERTDALVTGHAPRRHLRRKLEVIDVPQLGAYLCWHHSKLLESPFWEEEPTIHIRFDVCPEGGVFSSPLTGENLLPSSVTTHSVLPLRRGNGRVVTMELRAVSAPSLAYREVGWVSRPNRSWYDRDVCWDTQRTLLIGLSRH